MGAMTMREVLIRFLDKAKLKYKETDGGMFILLMPMDPFPESECTGAGIIARGVIVTLCWFCKEFTIEANRRREAMELITRINYGLPMGGFTLDRNDGEILFHSAFNLQDTEPSTFFSTDERPTILQKSFEMTGLCFARYLPAFKAFADGKPLHECLTLVNERPPTTTIIGGRSEGGAGAPEDGMRDASNAPWSRLHEAVKAALVRANLRFSAPNDSSVSFVYKHNEIMSVTVIAWDTQSGFVAINSRDYNNQDKRFGRHRLGEIVEFATRANYGMRIGYMRIEPVEEYVSYSSSLLLGKDDRGYAFDDVVETVRKGFELNYQTFLRYLPGIHNIINNNARAADEIARIEGTGPSSTTVAPSVQGATVDHTPRAPPPARPAFAEPPPRYESVIFQMGVTMRDDDHDHDHDHDDEDDDDHHHSHSRGPRGATITELPDDEPPTITGASLSPPSHLPMPHGRSRASSRASTARSARSEAHGSHAAASTAPAEPPLELADMDALVLGDEVGSGALGRVLRATYFGEPVAVKVITAATDEDDHALRAEVRARVALAEYPTILRPLGAARRADSDGSRVWLFLSEWCERGSLDQLLYPEDGSSSALTRTQRLRLMLDVARAMRYLHSKRHVHGDLRPQNILVTSGMRARLNRGSSLASKLSIRAVVPVMYVAPDVAGGAQPTTSSDVFSFGILLNEAAAGAAPWSNEPLVMVQMATQPQFYLRNLQNNKRPAIPSDIPEQLAALIKACWATDPGARMPFADIVAQLEAIVTAMEAPASAPAAAQQAAEPVIIRVEPADEPATAHAEPADEPATAHAEPADETAGETAGAPADETAGQVSGAAFITV